MAIRKDKITKAQNALLKAGMPAALTKNAWRLLDDLDGDLDKQIAELAEEDPELFEPADDDEPDEDEPMTIAEAKRARLSGRHRLAATRPDEGTTAERNAAALGANRPRKERVSTAPATAQAVAARLRAGLGNAVDREAY
ncbi:hypothetical protein ACN6LL_005926 [Streptomyces violaceoruber]